jgi:adenine/guanine/hypoxanthine permease
MSLESWFQIKAKGSTIYREIIGGVTTFVALSYIIFVQPVILSQCGMDKSAVMFATCFCSALACFIMGFWANLPIALAPAMGHNFFFAFTVCGAAAIGGFGLTWPEALAANCIAGILFLLLSLAGLRSVIMRAVPEGLKFAIAAGIGLLIAYEGFKRSGIIVRDPSDMYITRGSLINPVTLLSIFSLMILGILLALRFRGAILLGMILTAVAGYCATRLWGGSWGYDLVAAPTKGEFPQVFATAGKVFDGFGPLFQHNWQVVVLVIFTFLLLDVFDTIGTLIGLCKRADLLQNGKLPRDRQALMADAIGTLSGTLVGTSTVTSYVESSAGINAGARTGLAAVVTGFLLLASILAYPFVEVFGTVIIVPASTLHAAGGAESITCYPVIAPVLIVIGCYMLPVVRHIDWDDFSEALPAFLTIMIMPFAMSITDGIAWGFIAYAVLKLFAGKPRQCPLTVYLCAVLFVLYYLFNYYV